jgi:hypothetical protein
VVAADLNRDGKPDLVVVDSYPSNTFRVLLGNGDGSFQPVSVYDSFGGTAAVVADVNGDRIPDLIIANSYPDSAGVLLGNGDGTFKDAVSYPPGGTYTSGVVVGDVNGDGKLDLAVSNFGGGGTVGVLLGNGDGTFQPEGSYWTGGSYFPEAYSPVIVDVNGDRKPDLVVANWASGSIGVLLGNGDGTFQPAVTYRSSGTPYSIAVADVDQDGSPDLLAANSSGVTVDVLLGNGDGTFRPTVTYDTGSFGLGSQSSHSLAVADLNRDGRVDLAVAVPSASGVSVLLNNTGASPATTTLTSNPNPVPTGQPVIYTAAVRGQSGQDVSGWVKFQDAPSTIVAVPLINNQAAYRTSYRKGGTHTITATYSGDLHNGRSTSEPFEEYISSIPTKTFVNTSGSPSLINQPVTFSATVTSNQGPIPDGELITFSDGTAILGSVPLAGGAASITTSSLAARSHTIKATYVGDATFKPSPGRVTQVVNEYPTTIILNSSLNPSIYGQNVTFAAKVTATGSATPTGNVAFRWDGHSIGVAPLNGSGVATFTRSTLNAGSYPMIAVYLGDSVNAKITSDVLNQLVKQSTSSATINSSQNPSTAGQAVIFTATITSPTVLPGGSVTFKAGATVLGSGQLSHGQAQITTASLPVGLTKVTAIYNGDSNIAAGVASLTQKVQP